MIKKTSLILTMITLLISTLSASRTKPVTEWKNWAYDDSETSEEIISKGFQLHIIANPFPENVTLKTSFCYQNKTEIDEFHTHIPKDTTATFKRIFDINSQDLKEITTTLVFDESKRKTALYAEYDILSDLPFKTMEITSTIQGIFFNPIH